VQWGVRDVCLSAGVLVVNISHKQMICSGVVANSVLLTISDSPEDFANVSLLLGSYDLHNNCPAQQLSCITIVLQIW
jgi:hypothetical protein